MKQGKLVITDEKKPFQIEAKKSQYMAQVLFKLIWKENKTYVSVIQEPENHASFIGLLGNESRENQTDIFRFRSITEEERLEASFCTDCYEKLNLLLTLDASKINKELLDIIWLAAFGLRGYILNEFEGKTNLEYTIGSPIRFRQDVYLNIIFR